MRPAGFPALFVFDLGGTTIRDRGEVPRAFAGALERRGFSVDPARLEASRGASKREVLGLVVSEQRALLAPEEREDLGAALYEDFRAALAAQLAAGGDLAIPEALATFQRLKGRGARLAANSGFDRPMVDAILAAVDWPPGVLDAVVCADDVSAGRPAPLMVLRSMELTGVGDAQHVAIVGDTALDMEAGANAGARWRIGVLTGAHDRARLEGAGATHVVPSVGQVPDLWPGDRR